MTKETMNLRTCEHIPATGGGIAGGFLVPLRDLPDSLGHRVDNCRGSAVAEALDGVIVGAVVVFRGVP